MIKPGSLELHVEVEKLNPFKHFVHLPWCVVSTKVEWRNGRNHQIKISLPKMTWLLTYRSNILNNKVFDNIRTVQHRVHGRKERFQSRKVQKAKFRLTIQMELQERHMIILDFIVQTLLLYALRAYVVVFFLSFLKIAVPNQIIAISEYKRSGMPLFGPSTAMSSLTTNEETDSKLRQNYAATLPASDCSQTGSRSAARASFLLL